MCHLRCQTHPSLTKISPTYLREGVPSLLMGISIHWLELLYPRFNPTTSVNPVHNAPRLSVTGPAWGVGNERSVYRQTRPDTPGFRPTGPGVGVGEGKVFYRQTRPGTPGFWPTGPGVGGGGGRGLLQRDPAQFFRSLLHRPLSSPTPKTSVTYRETYWINILRLCNQLWIWNETTTMSNNESSILIITTPLLSSLISIWFYLPFVLICWPILLWKLYSLS